MNKRMLSIINEILKGQQEQTVLGLASQFRVSVRTIRNDLGTINEYLQKNGLAPLKSGSSGRIEAGEDFMMIRGFLSQEDFYTYKLSKEERIMISAALLINAPEYITLSAIADQLFVSRATVIKELDRIKDYLEEGNLHVISHSNKGLRLEGSERDKRRFLLNIWGRDLARAHLPYGPENMPGVQAGSRITVKKIINEQEHIHEKYLTDESFDRLQLYLRIMIQRNLQGEFIDEQEIHITDSYRMAQDILKYISQYCGNKVTENEIACLADFLEGCKYMKRSGASSQVVKIQLFTRRFIELISEELEINLNSDYDFYENLSSHLDATFYKDEIEFPQNDTYDEVLEKHPEVAEAVAKHRHVLEQYSGRRMKEIEITYIIIHVCAAIERRRNKESVLRVVVACNGGIGTSQLLLARLKQHFNFRITDIISAHEAGNIKAHQADLIITTVPLRDCALDYVVVTPLLNDDDYIRVGSKLDAIRSSGRLPDYIDEKQVTANGLLRLLKPVIYERVPAQAEGLMKEIQHITRNYFDAATQEHKNTDLFSPYLHQLLRASYIRIDVSCCDWKDAVRKSADILYQKHYFEACYIQAMIDNIEEHGPYIVLTRGFAMPHEGLDKGTLKLGMSLIRLKQPVNFGAEELDPVEFVCCLSTIDHKSHLKAIFHLVNLIRRPEFMQAMREAADAQELADIIEKYEYQI